MPPTTVAAMRRITSEPVLLIQMIGSSATMVDVDVMGLANSPAYTPSEKRWSATELTRT